MAACAQAGRPTAGPRAGGYSPCCRGPASVCVTEMELGTAGPGQAPADSPTPVQGYKMDDLLTSYVEQLLSTVNRPQVAWAPAES